MSKINAKIYFGDNSHEPAKIIDLIDSTFTTTSILAAFPHSESIFAVRFDTYYIFTTIRNYVNYVHKEETKRRLSCHSVRSPVSIVINDIHITKLFSRNTWLSGASLPDTFYISPYYSSIRKYPTQPRFYACFGIEYETIMRCKRLLGEANERFQNPI